MTSFLGGLLFGAAMASVAPADWSIVHTLLVSVMACLGVTLISIGAQK